MKKKLAKIDRAGLSIEREMLTYWIYVKYEEGGGQRVGGHVLDTYNQDKERREGTQYGCEIIRIILIAFKINDLHELKGRVIWIYGEGEGLKFKPLGISPLRVDSKEDHIIIFDDIAKEYIGGLL